MRISVKGRYALAAVTEVARSTDKGETVAVAAIAQGLEISKIYLEQVFSQLKKDGILVSVKGAKGGYQLAKQASKLSIWEVLSSLEAALVEPTEPTVTGSRPGLEIAMTNMVFDPLDTAVKACLGAVTVQDLLDETDRQQSEQAFMLNM